MKPANPLPHSLDAEKAVLGALLLDSEAILRVRGELLPEDFYDPVYGRIYEACASLFDERRAIDWVTVSEVLAHDAKIKDIGGAAFLAGFPADLPTSSNVEHHARIVKEKASLRALIRTSRSIADRASSADSSFTDLWGTAQEQLLALSDRGIRHVPEHLGEVSKRRYDVFAEVKEGSDEEQQRRVRTGFSNVDYYFNGFEPTTLNIIAGRPGMGKTALLLNCAANAVERFEKRVLFFSLEMSKEQLADRIIAGRLGVSMWEMQRGAISDEKMLRYGKVVDEIASMPLFIDDDPDTSLTNLRAKALSHQLEHGLDAIFVDYLQLIEPPQRVGRSANRTEQVSAISRDLKKLARELKVPVFAGCQLSRAVESRSPPVPLLSDLRESGTIEQDSDAVLMLYREGYYHEDCESPNLTSVYVRKNRQGPTGIADLSFDQGTMTFLPVDRSIRSD